MIIVKITGIQPRRKYEVFGRRNGFAEKTNVQSRRTDGGARQRNRGSEETKEHRQQRGIEQKRKRSSRAIDGQRYACSAFMFNDKC